MNIGPRAAFDRLAMGDCTAVLHERSHRQAPFAHTSEQIQPTICGTALGDCKVGARQCVADACAGCTWILHTLVSAQKPRAATHLVQVLVDVSQDGMPMDSAPWLMLCAHGDVPPDVFGGL